MRTSAGILLYRVMNNKLEVFLVHPGGPFWKNKDIGAWTIPKGEFTDENPLAAARREFEEETGTKIDGIFLELNPIKQKGGKTVLAWAVQGNIDPSTINSNTIQIRWPPNTDKTIEIPEIDKGGWFDTDNAKQKINSNQVPFIDQLMELLQTDDGINFK